MSNAKGSVENARIVAEREAREYNEPAPGCFTAPWCFTATEVAWWDGKAWRRKVVRTEKALERLVEKLNEAGVSDIRTREADV
jgi:hypothetical protein